MRDDETCCIADEELLTATTTLMTGITITLTPEEAALLEARAVRLGYEDAAGYLAALVRSYNDLEAAR